jgi:UTP--glucose-1-phosphate uridylyltransferase
MPKVTKAIIPVAGYGTRFLPATKVQPKEMLPIVDKPIIEFLVEEAIASGITDILFITHPTRSNVDEHFSRDKNFEDFLLSKGKKDLAQKIQHLHKQANFVFTHQDEPLGNGDAIMRGRSFIGKEPFAVFYADDVIISKKKPALAQLIQTYNKYKSSVMGLVEIPKKEVGKYGVINGKQVAKSTYIVDSVVEKPSFAKAPSNLVSMGRFVLTSDVFDYLEKQPPKNGEIFLSEALGALARTGAVYGYLIDGVWHDCGSKFGFWKATVELGLEHSEIAKDSKEYLKNFFENKKF